MKTIDLNAAYDLLPRRLFDVAREVLQYVKDTMDPTNGDVRDTLAPRIEDGIYRASERAIEDVTVVLRMLKVDGFIRQKEDAQAHDWVLRITGKGRFALELLTEETK